MAGNSSPGTVSTKFERIAELAKQKPGVVLTTLAHHIDIEWLKEAHRRVRKDGATGLDGRTAEEYAKNLEENLRSLLDRAKSGDHYRAPPVRRVHIPKGDGSKTRPIGIPRVRDGVLTRLIGKWLNAGVMEEGVVRHPETGTPQGGVISPLLANVYLHEVLDTWWERDVRSRLRGRATLVRYADDFVMVFETEEDARRVAEVLPKRFGKYGLRLHPEKTRLVRFERPDPRLPPSGSGGEGPSSFDLLGFTHFWAKSRKGSWVVKRKTAKDRFSRTLRRISMWCRQNRHLPIAEQHTALARKLRGHDAYYGITGNARALAVLRHWVRRIWQKWLYRRSWKARMTWVRMNRLLAVFWLPPARVVHSIYRAANP